MPHTSDIEPRWARLKPAAAYCGLSERTLRSYAAAKMIRLRHVRKPGASTGSTLVDLRELDRAIDSASNIPAALVINAPGANDDPTAPAEQSLWSSASPT